LGARLLQLRRSGFTRELQLADVRNGIIKRLLHHLHLLHSAEQFVFTGAAGDGLTGCAVLKLSDALLQLAAHGLKRGDALLGCGKAGSVSSALSRDDSSCASKD
jgi:hypothetical protein